VVTAERGDGWSAVRDPLGGIGRMRELHHLGEEFGRLPLEQLVFGERLDRRHGPGPIIAGGTNDRAGRQILVDELRRLGEDEVGLVQLPTLGIEVFKRQLGLGIDDAGERFGDRVAGLVVPQREVVCLDPADADDDQQRL